MERMFYTLIKKDHKDSFPQGLKRMLLTIEETSLLSVISGVSS